MTHRTARTDAMNVAAPRPGLFARLARRSLAAQHQRRSEAMGDAGLRDRGLSRAMREAMSVADLSDRVLG